MSKELTRKDLEQKIRRLEKEAMESSHIEERIRRLIEHSTDAFFIHDFSGKIIDVNRHACESLGYTRDELLGLSISDIELNFIPENLPDKWRDMTPGIPATFEGFHSRKDGTTFPVQIRLGLFEEGDEKFMLGIVRDITERVEAEDALKESEEKYRMLFEHSGFATSVSDLETGEIIAYNRKVYENLGYTRDEFKTMSAADIQPPKNAEDVAKERKKIIEKGPDVIETKHTTKKGDIRDILMSRVPVRIKGKYYIQHIYFDITEWKKLNAKLQNREAELEKTNNSLKEMNAALKVLLTKRDENKSELEEKVRLSIYQLVLPYLDKLQKSCKDQLQDVFFDIIKSNLNDITAPFPYGTSSRHLNLTPMEVKISNLIKQGKTSKEIADLFNLSFRTVDVHRANIRKKLGLKNEKTNLQFFLRSLGDT